MHDTVIRFVTRAVNTAQINKKLGYSTSRHRATLHVVQKCRYEYKSQKEPNCHFTKVRILQ